MVINLSLNLQGSELMEDTVPRRQPSSSSENSFFIIIDNPKYEEVNPQSSNSRENVSTNTLGTNNFSTQRIPLWLENKLLDFIALTDEEKRRKLINDTVSKLMPYLELYNYDEDSENYIWSVVDNIASKSISILGAAFQEIVIRRNDCVNILCAIAKCLCSFELQQTAEWGPMILLSLFSHKSDTVKEYAVFLLENWQDKSLLPILKNLDCRAAWLKAYIDSVVFEIEG